MIHQSLVLIGQPGCGDIKLDFPGEIGLAAEVKTRISMLSAGRLGDVAGNEPLDDGMALSS
jgi:hypothetical protein